MRVLVVGASGAIGTRLIPQLTDRGHEAAGSSRSAGKAGRLRARRRPIALDVLDARAVRDAVTAARPDALITAVRNRRYPIIGDGAGVTSFIHLNDAAAATVLASTTTPRPSTTSMTTSPPRHATGCRCSPPRSAPSRPPPACLPGSRGCFLAKAWP
jgi:nucleoside-diphosphate-sugar epimerase